MHGALEFNTKILLHRVQVSNMKLCHRLRLELGYSLFIIPCDKQIINIQDQNDDHICNLMVIEIGISLTFDQADLEQGKIHFRLPSTRALFETIKHVMKLTNEVFNARNC